MAFTFLACFFLWRCSVWLWIISLGFSSSYFIQEWTLPAVLSPFWTTDIQIQSPVFTRLWRKTTRKITSAEQFLDREWSFGILPQHCLCWRPNLGWWLWNRPQERTLRRSATQTYYYDPPANAAPQPFKYVHLWRLFSTCMLWEALIEESKNCFKDLWVKWQVVF